MESILSGSTVSGVCRVLWFYMSDGVSIQYCVSSRGLVRTALPVWGWTELTAHCESLHLRKYDVGFQSWTDLAQNEIV
jgi:hypothetical protein